MKQLTVISAGLSTPSTTRQVADTISAAVNAAVTGRGEELNIQTFELQEYATDLAQVMTTGITSKKLDSLKQQLSDSDGLIAVSPVFKASYTGLFKMFFDVLDTDALNGMPTIIAATAGTARHSLVTEYALRPLLTYLRAIVVPTALFAATEDFGTANGTDFKKRASRAAAELATYLVQTMPVGVEGLAGTTDEPTQLRKRSAGVNPDDDFVPFAQLLKGHDGNM